MVSPAEIVFRLLLGALLGGVIGFERHARGRPAGIRTHLLVSVGSVLVMIVSEYYHFMQSLDPTYIRVDPIRLAAGAITGVGFLGAGVIIKSGVNVQGLTTAASLWVMSVTGLAVGGGLYLAAGTAFVIAYLALWTLRALEGRVSKISYKFISVVEDGPGCEEAVMAILSRRRLGVANIDYERDREKNEATCHVTVAVKGDVPLKEVMDEIASLPSVRKITLRS